MGAKPPKRTQNSPESDSVSNFPSSGMWDRFYEVKNKKLQMKNRNTGIHNRKIALPTIATSHFPS